MNCRISSFHGQLKEIKGVYVDNFCGNALSSRAFFLSHCHTDHMEGLNHPELHNVLKDNPHVKIYTSEHSATILKHMMGDKEVGKALRVLDLGTTEITLPTRGKFNEEYITVTVIPAGHCLGSVMFLFKTSQDKTILYTGDFRIRENDIDKYAQLHSKGDPIPIDVLYIDTTFWDKRYQYFPKRTECINDVVEHVKKWLDSDEKNKVALKFSAGYGYEYVIMELFKRLDMKIYYKEDKYKLYSKMNFIKSAVTNYEEARLHDCCIQYETDNHSRCDLKSMDNKFLLVRFSAMKWYNFDKIGTSVQVITDKRIDVCFPTHCSRSEIKAFVGYYRPRRVEGFPNPYFDDDEPNSQSFLSESPVRKSPLKPLKKRKVIEEKVDRSVIRELLL